MTIFTEISLVVVLAVGFGFLAHLLRQPVIIGFIVAGLVIGYFEQLQLTHIAYLESLGAIGIALLLFLVGLEMNIKEWRQVGVPAFLVGLGQIIFTFIAGILLSIALGFSTLSSFYIASALTLSSTIVVVKLLSEKRDLRSLYGRVAIGILLLQDFAAITLILFLTGLESDGGVGLLGVTTLVKGLGLVVLTIIASRVLPKVLDLIGRSQEMLYLFGAAWALGVSSVAVFAGLSIEAGGFLAGLALANSAERFQISSRLRPLRDFFIILFFVILGSRALEGLGGVELLPAAALTLFVLIGTPLIVLLIMSALGYRSRTSFLTGIAVAQVSEFSFIVAALGSRLGHISNAEVSLITLVGLATIFVSSYFIVHNNRLYEVFRPLVARFEFRRGMIEETSPEVQLSNHTVLIGVHRMGEGILKALEDSRASFVALDFDPTVVKSLAKTGVPVVYGDIADSEVQEKVGLAKAKIIISTLPELKDNLIVIQEVKRRGGRAKVILTAEDEWSARELYKEGADYVILPRFLGGQELAKIISQDHNFSSLKELKKRDLKLIGG
ncbi:MAG: cation:proton antiporter [Candidatus Colwellbacteria bacterium]|nr:cation:proton antiporter [Candidatus Colwellbacteria bacterium]